MSTIEKFEEMVLSINSFKSEFLFIIGLFADFLPLLRQSVFKSIETNCLENFFTL